MKDMMYIGCCSCKITDFSPVLNVRLFNIHRDPPSCAITKYVEWMFENITRLAYGPSKIVITVGNSRHLIRYIKKSPNGTKSINVYDRLRKSQRRDQPIQGFC